MKIFISPSNQPANMYKGVPISEKTNCEMIATMVKAEMDKYEATTKLATFSKWYGDRPEEAKAFGADLVICIHTNAGGGGKGSGAVVFYNNARTQAIALKLVDTLNAIAPLKSNRAVPTENKVGELAEVTEPNGYGMDVLYIEVNFHDNSSIAPWLVSARGIISSTITDTVMGSYNIRKTALKPDPIGVVKPVTEALRVDGYLGEKTITTLQKYFGTPQDGVISRPSMMIRKLQELLEIRKDGYMGDKTIKALQKRMGTPQDGIISAPSMMVKELQRRLNKGKL